ncbi:hypothetical protein B0H13DRAFT_2317388 [Mycena leptocephala]|nr:hypothetical protein B0H13DRAFT_2317388 [Mycena leptocephala]
MLDNREFQDFISWGPEGDFFIVEVPQIRRKRIHFVCQLNKYDFHKIKTVDEDSCDQKSWVFRHPDFPPPPPPGPSVSSSHQLETQNKKIILLESQLTALGAAHQNVLTSMRTLERSNHEVIPEMISFQRNLAQQDGLLRALLRYLWRDSIGTGAGKMSQLPGNNSSDNWGAQSKLRRTLFSQVISS